MCIEREPIGLVGTFHAFNIFHATDEGCGIVAVACLVADCAVVLQIVAETPVGEKTGGGGVDVAEVILEVGHRTGYIPYAAFADIAVEETAVA